MIASSAPKSQSRFREWILVVVGLLLSIGSRAGAEHDGKIQILLLGDSTTIGSVCRKARPEGPHHEDVIRILLAAEKDLPPVNVINKGQDGDFLQRLLTTRYEKDIAKLPGIDFVIVRYGLNDQRRREDFAVNFPKDFHELIGKLRSDFPGATLIPMTVIPYLKEADGAAINAHVRKVAEDEKLTLFDIYPRYSAELAKGPNMLSYRRFPLGKVPEKYHGIVAPFVTGADKNAAVVVMDNQLDAHLGDHPEWYLDRHPNLAGYHVIGDETAKFLAPLIRAKKAK